LATPWRVVLNGPPFDKQTQKHFFQPSRVLYFPAHQAPFLSLYFSFSRPLLNTGHVRPPRSRHFWTLFEKPKPFFLYPAFPHPGTAVSIFRGLFWAPTLDPGSPHTPLPFFVFPPVAVKNCGSESVLFPCSLAGPPPFA